MPAIILLEFRPLRYLLLVFLFAVLQGAARGDPQGMVIFSVCALLLWWRRLPDSFRDVREWLYDARDWVEWTWHSLFG